MVLFTLMVAKSKETIVDTDADAPCEWALTTWFCDNTVKTNVNVIMYELCVVVYVGCATVGAAAWWFTMYEKGPQLNYYQLVSINSLYSYQIQSITSTHHKLDCQSVPLNSNQKFAKILFRIPREDKLSQGFNIGCQCVCLQRKRSNMAKL